MDYEGAVLNRQLLLRTLFAGREVEIKGHKYKLFRKGQPIYEDDVNVYAANETGIFTQGVRIYNDVKSSIWLLFSTNIESIFQLDDELSDEDATMIAVGNVLKDIHKRD